MLRFLGLLAAFILIVPLIRTVLGLLARLFSSWAFSKATAQPGAPGAPRPTRAPVGGALHKDPVCGTFVSEGAAVTLASAGKTLYFCSPACRDKYQA